MLLSRALRPGSDQIFCQWRQNTKAIRPVL